MPSPRSGITPKIRWQVFARDNYTCFYCGQRPPGVVLVVDHHIPVALGGSDAIGNLVTACEQCNQGKSDLHPARPLAPQPRLAPLSWAVLVNREPDLLALEENILVVARELADEDAEYCANREWYGDRRDPLAFGYRDWIAWLVGPSAFTDDAMVKHGAAIGVVTRHLWDLMPSCRHEGMCQH